MSSAFSRGPKPRRGRRLAYRLVIVATGLAVLYAGLWFAVAQLGDIFAARALAREEARGRHWSCGNAGLSGFPFSLRLTCPRPALTTTADEGGSEFRAAAMTATVSIFAPTRVDIQLTAPLTAKLKNGDTLTLAATRVAAEAVARLTAPEEAFSGLDIKADAPVLDIARAGAKAQSAQARQAHVRLARAAGDAAAQAHDVTVEVDGIEYPALLALMPNAGPGDLHIVGQLDHFELPGRGSRDERLERWRAAGGRFSVTQASFASATLRVEAEGPLGLDESHRLEGKLALKIRGAEALLQRFGLSAKMLNVGSTLGALLGGKPKPAGDEAGDGKLGKSLSLPLTLRDGKVSAGPFPLPVELLPLY